MPKGKHTSQRRKTSQMQHPLRGLYRTMIQRCEYKGNPSYKRYGARGIKVCERWRLDFWAFVEDMGPRPEGMTLDRIDTDAI